MPPPPGRPIALVTGATDGIGKYTAVGLLKRGYHVVIHGRNPEKLTSAAKEIVGLVSDDEKAKLGGSVVVECICGDYASLRSVKAMADEFTSRFDKLHVLVNNAGMWGSKLEMTEDGYERTLQVNHLSPFLLTNELFGLLEKAGEEPETGSGSGPLTWPARIVTVSSLAHSKYPNMKVDHSVTFDFDNINGGPKDAPFDPYRAYSQSKLLNTLHANELARRIAERQAKGEKVRIVVNSLHPGVIETKVFKTLMDDVPQIALAATPDIAQGAETSIYVATSPDLVNTTAKYYSDCKETEMHPLARDEGTMKRVWEVSQAMVDTALKK